MTTIKSRYGGSREGGGDVKMLEKVLQELVLIRKELRAIRCSLEHNYKINSGELSEKLKALGVRISHD